MCAVVCGASDRGLIRAGDQEVDRVVVNDAHPEALLLQCNRVLFNHRIAVLLMRSLRIHEILTVSVAAVDD